MTKWMISIMLRDGQDTGALTADTFQGLVEALVERGIELGVARPAKDDWSNFRMEDLTSLETCLRAVDTAAHPSLADEVPRHLTGIESEVKRRRSRA